jgi:hypothetical protein
LRISTAGRCCCCHGRAVASRSPRRRRGSGSDAAARRARAGSAGVRMSPRRAELADDLAELGGCAASVSKRLGPTGAMARQPDGESV